MDRLLYRRQFLLARHSVPDLSDWASLSIGQFCLHVHPDLEVTVARDSTKTLTLLGYLFDHENYQYGNQEILNQVLVTTKDFGDLVLALKAYAGRFVILYQDSVCLRVVQDALALREVYYCDRSDNLVICGSQPNLLVRFSQPRISESSDPFLHDFVQNHLPHVRLGRLWPGDGTPYEAVKHLLPNHYLDINRLEARRYWPNRPIKHNPIDEAISQCASFLKGVMRAASHRHELMLAVTAGLDSRALLAASREVSDSIYFFINKDRDLTELNNDVRIPKEIFKRIGLPFHVHEIPKDVPEKFKQLFLESAFYAHELLLPVIYNVYHLKHNGKVNVLGVGEVGRTKFFDDPKNLTPYYLAYMLRYRKSPYAVRECARWLKEACPIARQFGLNTMTLFWWEVLIGNWGSVGNSESDIAIEEFDPYASHFLYETFLSVDAKYRTFKDNILFEKLIQFMWPELLEVPVNPPEGIKDWRDLMLHRLGLEMPLRMLKFNLFSLLYQLIWKDAKTLNS